MRRRGDLPKPPTRFINLDRLPIDETEVDDLHLNLKDCPGLMANGWGEVSEWPAELMEAGDWTPAIWRSPELAHAARRYADMTDDLQVIEGQSAGRMVHATGQLLRGSFEPASGDVPGSFPILKSKGTEGQISIRSRPDEHWIPKKYNGKRRQATAARIRKRIKS